MRRISSRRNPLVDRYRAARRGDRHGPLLLDGVHLISEALDAGLPVHEAAVAGEAMRRLEIRRLTDRLVHKGVELVAVAAPVMDAISPVRSSSAIVALAARPEPAGNEIFGGPRPLVVIAADVQDPGNLGAIVRVAEAAGATGVVAAGCSADPFGWKALRGSMGSAFRLPIGKGAGPELLADARRSGCRVVAASPRGGRSLFHVDLTGSLIVVIGAEGRGLAPAWLEKADDRATVPMQPPVESLNAAVAAAVIVYEARRQRELEMAR